MNKFYMLYKQRLEFAKILQRYNSKDTINMALFIATREKDIAKFY